MNRVTESRHGAPNLAIGAHLAAGLVRPVGRGLRDDAFENLAAFAGRAGIPIADAEQASNLPEAPDEAALDALCVELVTLVLAGEDR